MPGFNRCFVFKIVKTKIRGGEHLGQHDDLTGVHRNGKRNLNRFPIFCLQIRRILVDDFLTGCKSA